MTDLPGPLEQFAPALIEHAPDGIAVVDDDGCIVWANTRLAEMLGYEPGGLQGTSIEDLLPPALRERHVGHRAEFIQSPHVRPMGIGMNLRAHRRDHTELPVEIALSPLESARGTFVIAMVRDISARRRAEETLWAAEEALAIADERERIARDLHDTVIQRLFATGLSLQAVAARIDDLEQQARVDEAVEDLDATIRQVRNAIFELQGPRLGTSVRRDVLDTARRAAKALGFSPDVSLSGPIDATVPDHVRPALIATLQEALANVARHAQASRASVTLRVGNDIVLMITDDGVGFTEPGRTGSGLANMKVRAEALGGTFSVRSEPGAGATVEWSVPLR